MTDTVRRTSRLLVNTCFACWLASAVYLTYRVLVVGLSPAEQRAAEQVAHRPLEALSEPVVAMLVAAVAVGVGIVCAIVYYGYAQWRAARRRRLELEPDLSSDRD